MIRSSLLLAAALIASLNSHAAESPMKLRVLTFNLRYITPGDTGERSWLARRDQVGQVIREDQADIIGLQEALRPMLDDVAQRVIGYQEIGVGREDGKTKGEYAAILIRKDRFDVLDSGTFWLSETPEIPNSKSWGNRVTRVCTWAKLRDKTTQRVFQFCNTHMDHESQEAREKGVGLILERLTARQPEGPFVITGDFNAGEDNAAIAEMKASPLHPVDSWRELNPSVPASESGTMSEFTGIKDTSKIDYIFVPSGTKLIDAEIIRRHQGENYPSDHYPVRATVEFP